MSFQSYCEGIDNTQQVTAEENFVLTYTNTKGEAFSVSPESIKSFLNFLVDNYETVVSKWQSAPSRKKEFFQYEEKSYREVFKSADTEELRTISSAGKSQTKALTKLISKVIAYLAGIEYQRPEINTLFEKSKIQTALINWNEILPQSTSEKARSIPSERIKEAFKVWMINKGLSSRTALSYSGAGINFCNKYLEDIGSTKGSFYEMDAIEVSDSLEELKKIPEWLASDSSGNSMYSAACKKLSEFLRSKLSKSIRISKPFLLLAGISGTGKSRFVREQARVTGSIEETYCLTSVRPDWHEPSDLLGYVSRLSKDNEAHYVVTDVLKFFAKAWRAIVDAEFIIETESIGGHDECLVVKGGRDKLNQLVPYWLCLDEMNLAPVEQYFADYLSVIETRKWLWEDNTFTYACDSILKPATIEQIADTTGLRHSLGFEDSRYDAVWELICKHGLSVPFNLIVAGTVNMDETTHGFSRKVIDRALSFDFGEFFPNNIDDFFTATKEPKPLTFPTHSNATLEMFEDVEADKNADKTKAFFVAVNEILKGSPFELAFRAFNELCLAVVSFAPKDDIALAAVFDDFLMCKVLPRIEGDEDRLSGQAGKNLLEMLSAVLENQLSDIWEATRPDLLQKAIGSNESAVAVECRSKKKLEWMNHQLGHGFTSFWP